MKFLFENWREFLDEGMKGLDDIPKDFYIETVCKTKTDIGIMYTVKIRNVKPKKS